MSNFTFGKGILSCSILCLEMIVYKNQFTFGKRIVPRQRMQKSASSGGFPISSSCKVSTIVVIWKVSDFLAVTLGNFEYIYLSAALEHSKIICLLKVLLRGLQAWVAAINCNYIVFLYARNNEQGWHNSVNAPFIHKCRVVLDQQITIVIFSDNE